MPCTIGFDEKTKILEVTYHGELGPDDLYSTTHDILTAMLEHKALRVLFDCSHAHFDAPSLDVYQLPDLCEAHGVARQAREAVVKPRDGYHKELFEFYEDVCCNRGFFVKLFDDAVTARAWLLEA